MGIRIKVSRKILKEQDVEVLPVDEKETPAEKKARLLRNKTKTDRQRKEYPSDKVDNMSRNKHLDGLFHGRETLRKLAKGIAEKKEQCIPHNANHSKDGTFSDGTDSGGSWSTGVSGKSAAYAASKEARTGCDRGQMRRSGKVRRYTKVPCGRKGREEGTYIRCRDGKKVMPEASMKLPTPNTDIDNMKQVDVDRLISQLRKKQDRLETLSIQLKKVRKDKCSKVMSVADLAVAIDAVQRATKGKLQPEPDKG